MDCGERCGAVEGGQPRSCQSARGYTHSGKNPFLWHDHWPVKDYARIFECLDLVGEIAKEADKVIEKIRDAGRKIKGESGESWWPVIHCKKLEQRLNINEICRSKAEIMERAGNIASIKTPSVLYLVVADVLLEDTSILSGWKEGVVPYEKKRSGVVNIYKKYPYLSRSAIDYEVFLRADVFVGNSFSTFSSLVVLERAQKLIRMSMDASCESKSVVRWPAYAYNVLGESRGPQRWITNMTDSSLQAISYGSIDMSC